MHLVCCLENMTNQDKQTIFVTIARGIIARNLLLGDFGRIMSEKYHVVLVTTMHDDEAFKKQFSQYDMIPLYPDACTPFKQKVRKLFVSIHKALIYNPTVELRSLYGMGLRNEVRFKKARLKLQKYVFGKLLAFNPVREFMRWVDAQVFPCNKYDEHIKTYNPVAIFASTISGDEDALLVRNAKKFNIPSIGMAKSWDNCSKFGFREKVDHLCVWGQYMKDEALAYQCYRDDQIDIVGIPQFDCYPTLQVPTREEFCASYGLDPHKKIIYLGSEGPINEYHHVVPYVRDRILDGTLANYQILCRPHFSYRHDIDRFRPFVDNKIVFLDDQYEYSNTKDGIATTLDMIVRMVSQIRNTDVAVTGVSTLALDVTANHKPVLFYSFDKDETVPYKDSVRRFYTSLWFTEIQKMGLDNIATSGEHLVELIKEVEENPDRKLAERNNLISHFCYKVDGNSAKRLFGVVERFVSERS